MWVKKAAIAAALLVAVAGAAPGVAIADPTTPATPDPAAPTSVAPAATPKTTIDADGIYAVGTDIAPGVYTTAGPVGDGACFWKRVGNPDGATIDNALTKKPQTVQIDPTDQSFKTNGCQPWQLTEGAPPPQESGLAPVIAGLQLQAYMAQLNARAAASGQAPPP
ncbi:hypothetical protein [Mycolicibacterium hodleri]|uniref:Lipoprotein n=1 Tax=Mycolicibacterium hodleri TaxID=49897 RepID=A0A502EHX1_9MYCO|nr:hypothetical protein [Mycolicibacterium hodleri]TPG37077.1 hypothetical protein EAH80_04250 [Mycolicibacterium hodleri]